MIFRVLLNVLSLLKREPKTFDELFASGLFPRWKDLEFQLDELEKAKIILSNRLDEQIFYTLGALGQKFLEFYPQIKLKEVDLVYNKEERKYVKLVQRSFPR